MACYNSTMTHKKAGTNTVPHIGNPLALTRRQFDHLLIAAKILRTLDAGHGVTIYRFTVARHAHWAVADTETALIFDRKDFRRAIIARADQGCRVSSRILSALAEATFTTAHGPDFPRPIRSCHQPEEIAA